MFCATDCNFFLPSASLSLFVSLSSRVLSFSSFRISVAFSLSLSLSSCFFQYVIVFCLYLRPLLPD